MLKISWLKITSVLFDCLHIGFYVLGGLFFWPWIWNNLTIWWGARSQKQGLSFNTKVACIATIGLGAPALHLNEAAWLAWYDVADSRHVFIEAVTKDGEGVKAPNAFFTGHSYSISHAYMGNQPEANQYDFTQLGSSHVLAANKTSGTCPTPLPVASPASESPEARAERLGNLERFLKANHAKMLAREDTFGRGSYYWRLHHHPSNPFLYDAFNKLSPHDVVGYRLVTESQCLTMDHGKVVKKAWPRMAEYFSVE